MSHYDELGVAPTANLEQIDKAYRELSKKYHPDSNPGREEAAAKDFKRVQEAFEILTDPETRAAYDETLRRKNRPKNSRSSEPPKSGGVSPPKGPPDPTRDEPEPESPQPPKRRLFKNPQFIVLVIGGVLVLIAGLVTVINRPPSSAEIAEAESSEAAKKAAKIAEEENLKKAQDEASRSASQRKQQAGITASKLKVVRQEGDKVSDLLRSLDEELDAWDKNMVPLLTNAKGKSIAADDERIRAFEKNWSKPRPTKSDAAAIRDRLKVLMEPIDTELAKDQPLAEPESGLSEQLKAESAAIQTAIGELRGPRRQIERLVEIADRQGKSSSLTLKDAIDDLAAKDEKAANDEIARVAKEGKDLVTAAETARMKVEAAEGVRVKNAEADLIKKRADSEIEKGKLKKKAESPATRTLLAFFFTPGYHQPDGTQTGEKRPISLSRLEAKGCLEPTAEGQTKLLVQALLNGADNDRPKWDEAPFVSTLPAAKREKLIQIQKALIELGPTLVELKMLDP